MNTCIHPPKRQSALIIVVAALACLLSGCATTHHFTVDALSRKDANNAATSFRLVDATGGVHEAAIPYAQVATDVKTALSSRGMYEAPPDTTPFAIVTVEYGFKQPRRVIRTNREMVLVPSTNGSGTGFGGSGGVSGPAGFGPGGSLEIQDRIVQSSEIILPKFLRLTARAATSGDRQIQLWFVEVQEESTSTDLGHILPMMTAAAMDHIGTNSSASQPVTIATNDNRVRFVAQGL